MTKLNSIKHADKRANIPTQELRGFVADEEQSPKTLRYPRDPSLDPQLVWRGKDEQDRQDLTVKAVPIYIQEKIHPRAIVELLRKEAKKEAPPIADLFADFNGIQFEDLVDFYRHEQNWSNRLILGDSLMVMASLVGKEGLRGKVQMIYMDPPYGIKFGSNWQVSTRKNKVGDSAADASREPEVIKAFRDTWSLGINSYLSYLRDRFRLALELLTETGSIFVQIGDENVHLVRCVLDEIFGSQNHVVTITVKKKGSQKSSLIDPVNDYLLWYSKATRHEANSRIQFHNLYEKRELDGETLAEFDQVELADGRQFPIAEIRAPDGTIVDYRLRPQQLLKDYPGAKLFRPWPITNGGERKNQSVPFNFEGAPWPPPKGRCWSHTARTEDGSPSGMDRVARSGRIIKTGKSLDFKRYLDDFGYKTISNWWDGLGGARNPIYVVQTNTEIIKRCMLMTTSPGDLVLDPTCGSGSTAYVAEQWGRRWITTDTSRVALALARTRLMAARFPWFILADSQEGIKREAEITGQAPQDLTAGNDIRKGFVCQRIRYVTSGAIANTTEMDGVHDRWQPILDDARGALNKAADTSYEEWEVPREPNEDWNNAATDALKNLRQLRIKRQADIDAMIARQSGTRTLYDHPYQDPKRIRVSGPFTVESLSPHRVLPTDSEAEPGKLDSTRDGSGLIATLIDYLRKAGVQNTKKDERLKFDRLEPFAGVILQAEGEFTDAAGATRRVAVAFGPETGTVGPQLVREAAMEAVKGAGFDILLVCGFALDPHVGEEAKNYGKLTVLPVRMNPDLAMGDELLKKTGSGNLFMVFGEPDIAPLDKHGRVTPRSDGQIVVTIKGVDVYDPTTGQIRSNSTDDIACWFIDSDYNGQSFFVRHAYFTGADRPYERLQKALKADIDETAWASIYSTVSRPFDRPKSGKIAIKVINHYGDEVLKVYAVA
jgi:adenine-specific DNA-methyltransferase